MRATTIASLAIVFLLGGCATTNFMPTSSERTNGGGEWASYEEARAAFDKIVPGTTTTTELGGLGINVGKARHNYAQTELVDKFLRSASGKSHLAELIKLPPSVDVCMNYVSRCDGKDIYAKGVATRGDGSVIARVADYRVEDETVAWEALIFLVIRDDIVLYAEFSGSPGTSQHKMEERPFGPIQSIVGKGRAN